ncbi:type VI secretion system membrane subunit TssM [Pseudomonas syringae]|nr:type VI secretion system membrane subunit TssM [Pseudomonas syringae]MBD8792838.1 type VI secretion system membrane subunit TssM [Pseudomonas syringae]MBD8803341.1 type VI secretion system membrane subunit TssM [Pseudomonas syringae]MBD8811938.1 type VI secretion system membrane subunit TssM [Pseudomonas syringae]
MNLTMKKILSWLGQTWLWSLALVMAGAALVWWIGPMLAINDLRPWASVEARLATFCILLLLWGLGLASSGWRASRPPAAAAPGREHDKRLDDEGKELQQCFNEAVRTLGHSSLYRDHAPRARDELPWYLLIGPPGSGKTRLLECSELEFPLNRPDRLQTGAHTPTRHCDWYFAGQAVVLDTAGRYLTQPEPALDGHAWMTLLGLLRKRRRVQPLNGVLVNIPVTVLLEGQDQERLALAGHLRERLQELHRVLRVQVPVYLILSQADQVPGFEAFFDALSLEQNRQVLGASFSPEQPATEPGAVRQAFEALLRHFDSQLIGRLHHERDTYRRSLVLGFTHPMSVLGEHLCEVIDTVFNHHRYQRSHLLRGFYLTSAPHPGHPAADARPQPQRQAPDHCLAVAGASGRVRFIHELFSKVIFPEAGLVGLDPQERRRIHWGQRAWLAGGLATLVLGGLLWARGFGANHERLETLRVLAGQWQQQHKTLHPDDDAMALLKVLQTSDQASQVFVPAHEVAWYERNGLYQGKASQPVLRAVYERELLEHLLPQVSRLLEARIAASLHDREALLGNLRAYLMLNLPARRETPWLKDWLAAEWSRLYAGHNEVQSDLNRHFEQLLALSFSQPLNDSLVLQARQTLRSESLASVVYRTLREQARALPDYRLSQHLGPQRDLFVGADRAIPGLFTRQGYRQFFSVQGTARVSELLRDNWVLGEGSDLSGRDLRQLLVELEQLYFRDYASHWSEAVAHLGLLPFSDAGEGADLAAGLLSSSSPVVQFLVQIRDNTRFALPAEPLEAGTEPAGAQAAVLGKAAAGASQALALPDNARRAMQQRFEPLHRLLDDKDAPSADLVAALQGLDAVQQQLASLARASQPEQFAFEMARARMGGQRDALSQLRNTAARLPRPVSGWFNLMAEDAWRLVLANAYQHLNQRYQSELYAFYAKAIAQRYPFSAHSTSDVALNDFREFFKAQGVLESFFEQHLKAFVSGHPGSYRLRSIDGHSLPMSRALLDQMSAAQRIRQGFFAEDPNQPQVRFKLEPYSLDSAVNRAEFRLGERTLEYRHGPIVPMAFTWPDDAGQGGASLVAERLAARPVGIEKNLGPWSLFRLLDLMQIEPLSGRDVLVLKANLGGLRANYLLTSQRMPNPFDVSALRGFRLPAQL